MSDKKNEKVLSSKMVHARIPIVTLIGCYDIMEFIGGKSIENYPMASCVRDCIEGFISGAQKKDSIPTYTQEELEIRYAEIFDKDDIDVSPDFDVNGEVVIRSSDVIGEDKKVPLSEIIQQAAKSVEREVAISNSARDNITNDQFNPEGDNGSKEQIIIRTDDIKYNIAQLEDIRPMDSCVLEASKSDNELLKTVTCYVYSILSESEMSDQLAYSLINDILNKDIQIK